MLTLNEIRSIELSTIRYYCYIVYSTNRGLKYAKTRLDEQSRDKSIFASQDGYEALWKRVTDSIVKSSDNDLHGISTLFKSGSTDVEAYKAFAYHLVTPSERACLEIFLKHFIVRFQELWAITNINRECKVYIPCFSNNVSNNSVLEGFHNHSLGGGLAVNQWLQSHKTTFVTYCEMRYFLDTLVKDLHAGSNQVFFITKIGTPGSQDAISPSTNNVVLWGANASNWDLKPGTHIHGSGQAAAIKTQRAGSYGIVTTPLYTIDNSIVKLGGTNHLGDKRGTYNKDDRKIIDNINAIIGEKLVSNKLFIPELENKAIRFLVQ